MINLTYSGEHRHWIQNEVNSVLEWLMTQYSPSIVDVVVKGTRFVFTRKNAASFFSRKRCAPFGTVVVNYDSVGYVSYRRKRVGYSMSIKPIDERGFFALSLLHELTHAIEHFEQKPDSNPFDWVQKSRGSKIHGSEYNTTYNEILYAIEHDLCTKSQVKKIALDDPKWYRVREENAFSRRSAYIPAKNPKEAKSRFVKKWGLDLAGSKISASVATTYVCTDSDYRSFLDSVSQE